MRFYDTYEEDTEPGHGYLENLKNDVPVQKCYRAMVDLWENKKLLINNAGIVVK